MGEDVCAQFSNIIAANLYNVRKSHGYTQEEFAQAAGVAPSQIANGEKGRFQVPASRICRISLHTGIPVLDFFRGIDLPDFVFHGSKLSAWQNEEISELIRRLCGGRMSGKGDRHKQRKVNDIDRIIGDNIRTIRTDKGWSQAKLAGELGVTAGQMCLYERGGNRLPSARLCRLSQILNVPVLEFLKGIDLPDHKIRKTSLEQDKALQIIDIIGGMSGAEKTGDVSVVVLNNTDAQ